MIIQANSFFNWLGETLGTAIRWVIDTLAGFFASIGTALQDFIDGLTGSLGINDSLFSLAALILGLLLLYKGARAFLRRAIVAGLIWSFLSLLVLSWLIA